MGTWTDLGILAEGQALIGGSSANGALMEHDHLLFNDESITSYTRPTDSTHAARALNIGGDNDTYIAGSTTYPSLALSSKTGAGGDYNKAYGLGVGLDIHIWKRIS